MDYNDPFESAIEQLLFVKLKEQCKRGVVLTPQKWFETSGGSFRVDGNIEYQDIVFVVECDGKEFHDYRRDRERDRLLLSETPVQSVIRFSGHAIMSHAFACVWSIAHWYPNLFDARATAFLDIACPWMKHENCGDNFCNGRWSREENDFFICERRLKGQRLEPCKPARTVNVETH